MEKIVYDKFKLHHIEISEWVMQLDNQTIKNTIIHEILHCLPACNNHGILFKSYAKYINKKLGYNISRLGNKEANFKKNNIIQNTTNIKLFVKSTDKSFINKE